MIYTTSEFQNAIKNSANQKAYVDFGDFFLDSTDISSNGGISLSEYFNPAKDYTVGSSGSARITLNVINKPGLIDYRFESFNAFIGVCTKEHDALTTTTSKLYLEYDENTVVKGSSATPYLLLNDVPFDVQPTNPIVALLCRNGFLYAIEADGNATKYEMPDGTFVPDYVPSDFLKDKFSELSGQSIYYGLIGKTWNDVSTLTWENISDQTWGKNSPVFVQRIFTVEDGNVYEDVYQFCKLGQFFSESPYITNDASIQIVANDKMILMEKMIEEFWDIQQFPISISNLIQKICEYANIRCSAYPVMGAAAKNFNIGNIDVKNKTIRQILEQIAQATGHFVRFDRNGDLEFCRFEENDTDIDWNYSLSVANYTAQPITQVIDNGVSSLVVAGQENIYQITNDLFGLTESILNELLLSINNFYNDYSYSPAVATVLGNPAFCAGDVVTVKTYAGDIGIKIPIFSNSFTWNGVGSNVFESTGSEYREVDSSAAREIQRLNNSVVELHGTTQGVKEAIDNHKLVFDENGLRVYNGGFQILNDREEVVFDADEQGDLSIAGTFSTSNSTGSGVYTTELKNGALRFLRNKEEIGSIRAIGNIATALLDAISLSGDIFGLNQHIRIDSQGFRLIEKDDQENDIERINIGKGANNDYVMLKNPYTGTGTTAVFVGNASDGYTLERSSSSIRYKKNVENLDVNAKEMIDALKPITYQDKNRDSDDRYFGFIAEDVDKVCKNLVFYTEKDGELVPDSLAYDRFTVLLVADNQRMHKQIEQLEEKINELEQIVKGKNDANDTETQSE